MIFTAPKLRHPGMDCRGPGYMDVNELMTSHVPVFWIPAIHAGMTAT
ncbi:MAG: hypothetical protein HOP23_18040 [Methylococcaceae bacterium]|nr:hypothetical protein [Methylococcaceae bacterium]